MTPFLLLALLQTAEPPIRPSAALGFEPGTDSMLADWRQVSGYMNDLAQRSPYVRVDTLGRTTEGRPFLLMTITSPVNQDRLADIKRAQALLADPRRLTDGELEDIRAKQPERRASWRTRAILRTPRSRKSAIPSRPSF